MMEETTILSLKVVRMSQDLAFYLQCVNYKRSECDTAKQAWELVELELSQAGLNPRYTSYESFKSGMSQFHKRRKSN